MTYEEALNIKQNWTPIQARNDLERYLLRGELPAAKAFALGMQALENQIPKKIRVDNEGWLCCPNCDENLKLHNQFKKRNKCCGECGQALDWSNIK